MLTTHNFKMLNPAVSQAPLCQEITGEIPKHLICSKTVDIQSFVWPENLNDVKQVELARSVSDSFYNNGKLPKEYNKLTQLTDAQLHNLYVFKGDVQTGEYCAISPAPCCGLFNEIILRDKVFSANLSSQQVEVRQDRLSMHGSMITHNNGVIKSFLLPQLEIINNFKFKQFDEEYVILAFDIDNFSVSTGMVGIGIPPVSVFGIFVANFLQKDNLSEGDIPFAIGIQNFNSPNKFNQPNSKNKQHSVRKASLQGYLVLKPNTESQKYKLIKRLESELRIAGSYLSYKNIIVSKSLPNAYWLVDLSDEIDSILSCDPDSDALDIAFDFMLDGRLTVPVASGFAFMGEPEFKSDIPTLKHPHCWAETLFKNIEIRHGFFNPKYFFKRHSTESMVLWKQ